MPRKSGDNMPKGIETRSTSKNAEDVTVNKTKVNAETNAKRGPKSSKEGKEKSNKVMEKIKKAKSAIPVKTKNALMKSKSPKKQVNKGSKDDASKSAKADGQSSQTEVLDYDETGLDDQLQTTAATSRSEQISEPSDSSSEDSTSSSESEDTEDEQSTGQSDFSDGPEQDGNKNNGATPESGSEGEPVHKKRKLQKTKTSKKGKSEKLIKMSTGDIQKLISETIANYEKQKNPYATEGKRKLSNQAIVQHSKSDTTIYSRLCPPVGETDQSVNNELNQQPEINNVPSVLTGVAELQMEDPTNSDESVLAQFNSSDELIENPTDSTINVVGLPLPPPPPRKPDSNKETAEQTHHPKELAHHKAEELVKQAELQKAELAKPPGENQYLLVNSQVEFGENIDGSLDYLHNSGTAHVDQTTREKVRTDQYVELYKFLPRDLDLVDEDDNLVLTSKQGRTYHVPPVDREDNSISTFKKWQVAFKVFMSVYIEEHPDRLKKPLELIQYTQLIEGMTTTWIWDNVYKYDKKHRRMMQTFPGRKWHVPYDLGKQELRITHASNPSNNNPRFRKSGGNGKDKSKKEPCRNYNKGKCSYGAACRFDHRCSKCGKYGHNALNCRSKEKEINDNGTLIAQPTDQ